MSAPAHILIYSADVEIYDAEDFLFSAFQVQWAGIVFTTLVNAFLNFFLKGTTVIY